MNRRRKGKDTANVKEVVQKINVAGYEEFQKTLKEFYEKPGEKPQLHVLFTGEKNAQGVSWCPDCNLAAPYIQQALAEFARKDSVFLEVDVGNRESYMNRENPFRLDHETRIQEIPTLVRWNTVFRLEGLQCMKPFLLEMLFNEPDQDE